MICGKEKAQEGKAQSLDVRRARLEGAKGREEERRTRRDDGREEREEEKSPEIWIDGWMDGQFDSTN